MIRVEGIGKRFGRTPALRNVSFQIAKGERVGFVGPNGAGKSTMLRILTGFIAADEGAAAVAGFDVAKSRRQACQRIGYMPDRAPLHEDMRVSEFLAFRARVKGVSRQEIQSSVAKASGAMELDEVFHTLIGRLSRGFRQRVALADALVADPPILLLDEPTTGLDPIQRRNFREVLARSSQDRCVLFSSHLLSEVSAIAERYLVLHQGALVAQGTLEELRAVAELGESASTEDIFAGLVSQARAGDR